MIHPLRLVYALARSLGRRLPTTWVEGVILTAANAKASALSPRDGLEFLFRLDNRLYESQSRLAKELGGGEHPKHRLTRYHDFFVERISPGERVLDVGCGQGQLAAALAKRAGAKVTGIDLSPENIELAKQRHAHPNLVFTAGDALLALPGGPFDSVVLSNVLEHLPDRSEFLRRLVAATGAQRLLIRVPLFEREWRIALKRELGIEWRTDPTHETEHRYEEFMQEIKAAGLELLEEKIRWGEIWAVARAAS
jgi:SAM-dependent methyltransferase